MIRAGAHALVGVLCCVLGIASPWTMHGAVLLLVGGFNIAVARERWLAK